MGDVNWELVTVPPLDGPAPTTNSGRPLLRGGGYSAASKGPLMQWGPNVQFEVWPLNYHEMEHEGATAWSRKEIVGAATYREWVGEQDELRYLRGRLFPYRLGGMREIEILDAFRRGGIPNLLTDGNGRRLGWYVIEKLQRTHQFISGEGIGQMINFDAYFARVPVPEGGDYLGQILNATGGQPGATPTLNGGTGPFSPNAFNYPHGGATGTW